MRTGVFWILSFVCALCVACEYKGPSGMVTWLALIILAEIEANTRK